MSLPGLNLLAFRRRPSAGAQPQAAVAAAFEQTDAAHAVVDAAGAVVFANRAARTMLGQPVLRRLEDLLAAIAARCGGRDRLDRLHHAALAGSPGRIELAHPVGGRTQVWRVDAVPVDGFPGTLRWRIEDITAQRELEAELSEERAKLQEFMDQAPVGFYSVDQQGRFIFANATLAAWLEFDAPEQLTGVHALHQFLAEPPADAPPYALTGPADPPIVELVLRGRRGRRFEASVTQTVIEGEGGRAWTRSVVRDLTSQKQMREALRASEMRFRHFFEDAPIGLALVGRDMRLTEWNPAFTKLTGAAPDELAGRPITDLVDERDRRLVKKRLAAVLARQEEGASLEVTLLGRGKLVVSLLARRLESEDQEAADLILQFIDQTERKNLESQFSQSQKMQAVGQLAGGIAHDFNNLLTAMIGFCDLLLLRHKPGDASFADIMQIKQNANRAANLVRQLLAFSRQQTLQPKVLNVTDTLADLSHLLRRLIGENIELRMVHGRDLGLVKVDEGQLGQVIMNLVVNARDAMPQGGRLTVMTGNTTLKETLRHGVEAMPPGDYVTIEVIDTGTGIPPEILDRIFEPFFSTKEVGSGTGLGLSTVYGIVRQTGGYVFVDSEVGRGTKFTIHLPRWHGEETTAPAETEAREAAPSDLTGVGCILLVEDEDPVRLFSARALRNKGYKVLEAASGEQALELLGATEETVDLLITDVVMPKMDGPTLVRHVRAVRPDIRVICISGYAEDKIRQHIGVGENIAFLPKPFSLKQLAAKVKEVLRAAD